MSSTVRKISVAIGRDELAWARSRAKRENTSVSAVLTNAARLARDDEARVRRQHEAWSTFVDWATGGEGLREDEIAAATRELASERGEAPRGARSKKR